MERKYLVPFGIGRRQAEVEVFKIESQADLENLVERMSSGQMTGIETEGKYNLNKAKKYLTDTYRDIIYKEMVEEDKKIGLLKRVKPAY